MRERRVVGVSLGSPGRDFRSSWVGEGGVVHLWRVGTGGDVVRAARLLATYDGEVDAFGLGGVNLYLQVRGHRYLLPAGERLARVPRRTPVCDGTFVKAWWEPRALEMARQGWGEHLAGRTVLFSSVLDRWPLAQALEERGARVLVGDAAFALRVPILFSGLASFYPWAVAALPVLRHLPLSFLYPLGRRREESRPGLGRAFARAEVLAGDFHFLRWRLPPRLDGKWVIGTGLDGSDLAMLAERGAAGVVELGPLARRRRGLAANMAEALVVAISGQRPAELGAEGMLDWCGRLGFRPTIYRPPLWDGDGG